MPTLPELLEWVKAFGAAGGPIFLLLWWLERGERIDAQGEIKQIAKESIAAIVAAEKTIDKWLSVFSNGEHR